MANDIEAGIRIGVKGREEVDKATESVENLDNAVSKVTSTIEKNEKSLKVLRGQSIQTADGVVKLGDGFTKMQSNQLAMLQMAGATNAEMKQLAQTFREYNAITGRNTFDKSASGASKLKQEIVELESVNKLMSKGYNLTKEQIVDLAREHTKLTQIYQTEGKSKEALRSAIRRATAAYVEQAEKLNTLKAQAAESSRIAKEESQKRIEESNRAKNEIIRQEKELAQMRTAIRKQWAESVGSKSPELSSMADFYSKQENDAQKLMSQAAIAQKKSSDQMFTNYQMKQKQDADNYQKDMAALNAYYTGLEKLDQNNEKARKQSFDNMVQIHRLKNEQDRAEYKKAMADMREYYSALEKETTPTTKGRAPADMDAHVAQYRQAQAKASREAAAAAKYLTDAETRLNAAVNEVNNGLSERHTNKLVKYEAALQKSGVSADVAAAKLANFKGGLDKLAAKERADELNYLSRALSVQMGDVAVSLASGMNPLLVMIQQGDQIRGVLQQVGAEGKELSKAMNTAAAQIATSFIDTGKAIGGFFLGALKSAGETILNAIVSPIQLAVESFKLMRGENANLAQSMAAARASFISLAKLAIFPAAAALIAYGVALKQVITEENALARQLALSGGALGLSHASAIQYAKSLTSLGFTTGQAMQAMTEMAKAGNLTAKEYDRIATAAINMEKYAGIAIADTVKAFSELKKDPVEAIEELAKKTGMVAPEVVKLVNELVLQGRTAEAVAVAMKTLADVNEQQITRMKNDLNGFSLFMIDLGQNIKKFFDDAFKSMLYKTDPTEQIKKQLAAVNDILNNNAGLLGVGVSMGIGREYYENLRNDLSKQLMIMENIRVSEEERTRARVEGAKIEEKAAVVRNQNLNREEKYLKEINELLSDYNKATREGRTEAAAIFQQAIARKSKEYQDSLDRSNSRKTPGERAQNKIDSAYARELEKAKDLLIQSTGAQQNYTKAQKALLDMMDNPTWKSFTKPQQEQLKMMYEKAHALELETNQLKEAEKQQEANAKALTWIAESTRDATGASQFFGSFLDGLNERLMEGAIDANEFADALNRFSRLKWQRNDESIGEGIRKEQKDLNQGIERDLFERGLTGTDADNAIAMKQYDIRIQKENELIKLQEMRNAGDITEEILNKRTQEINALYAQKEAWVAVQGEMDKAKRLGDELADVFSDAFSDLISGGKSFSDVLKGLEKGIMDVITQVLVLEPLKASLKGMMSGGVGDGGIIQNIFSSILGFADGGRPPVNQVSIVGERGPELFVPDTAGTIIPNHSLQNMAGQQTVTIIQNFTIQGHSADRSTQAQVAASALQGANRALARNT